MNNQIVKSKKCELCKQQVLLKEQISYIGKFKNKFTRLVEIEHYCDGGESHFINKMDESRKYYNESMSIENRPYSMGFA
jgi:hypothetical protein